MQVYLDDGKAVTCNGGGLGGGVGGTLSYSAENPTLAKEKKEHLL